MNVHTTYPAPLPRRKGIAPSPPDNASRVWQPRRLQRSDVEPGDTIVLTTQNSVYTVRLMEDETVLVSGGWFDRTGRSTTTTTIEGCTWDGLLLDPSLLAACGMHVHFGEVVTSRIKKMYVVRPERTPDRND